MCNRYQACKGLASHDHPRLTKIYISISIDFVQDFGILWHNLQLICFGWKVQTWKAPNHKKIKFFLHFSHLHKRILYDRDLCQPTWPPTWVPKPLPKPRPIYEKQIKIVNQWRSKIETRFQRGRHTMLVKKRCFWNSPPDPADATRLTLNGASNRSPDAPSTRAWV